MPLLTATDPSALRSKWGVQPHLIGTSLLFCQRPSVPTTSRQLRHPFLSAHADGQGHWYQTQIWDESLPFTLWDDLHRFSQLLTSGKWYFPNKQVLFLSTSVKPVGNKHLYRHFADGKQKGNLTCPRPHSRSLWSQRGPPSSLYPQPLLSHKVPLGLWGIMAALIQGLCSRVFVVVVLFVCLSEEQSICSSEKKYQAKLCLPSFKRPLGWVSFIQTVPQLPSQVKRGERNNERYFPWQWKQTYGSQEGQG